MSFDVAILGGGPGGYVAALRAAQLGLRTALVEKDELGGVCLNAGCIPSKTLLTSADLFSKISKCSDWGIDLPGQASWNLKRLAEKKNQVITRLRAGIAVLVQKRGIALYKGLGQLEDAGRVKVGAETLEAKNIVIATGSRPKRFDWGLKDCKNIWTSIEALELRSIPPRLLILGAGPEGCEFSLIYSALGSKVFLVEAQQRILPGFDPDAAAVLKRTLAAKRVEILAPERVQSVKEIDSALQVIMGSGVTLEVDTVILCTGRKPNVEGFGLEKLDTKLDPLKNALVVNKNLETSIPRLYAIGDVIGGFMMAHSASYEGYAVAEKIAGKDLNLDYRAVPSCVYTSPEVAQVGLSEEAARAQGIPCEVGKFSFSALGRSHAKGTSEGFLKVIGNAKTGELLGVVIVGDGASELVSTAGLALQKKATVADLCKLMAPHPSASEAISEAAHLFFKEGLHFA